MQRHELYEWWIDSIQDCLGQVAGQLDSVDPHGGQCSHVCDETFVDLEHFVDVVQRNGYCDVPAQVWATICALSQFDDLESDSAKLKATQCLASTYFQDRVRWQYDRPYDAG